MSVEDAETREKNKLMEILEEELSVLKMGKGEINETNRNESKILQNTEEIEVGDNQENIRSSSDKTAEVLHKIADNENEESKADNKAFDPPRATNEDTLMQKNDYENRKNTFTEKMLNHSSGVVVKQYLGQNCTDENKPTDKEANFVPPPESLAEKIIRRLEFMFQDYNIFKNSYLLNIVRRNKKGFVSLKVVASLRKIRALTKDYRVIAYSLMKSNIFELNSEKTKVRRIEPIPKIESTSFGKTVMVFNVPREILSNDSFKNFFGKFGTVVSARLHEIHSEDINAYHKRCLTFHRKISSETYGIVEFENYDAVVSVLKDVDGHLLKENDMKVVPLVPQIYKKEKRYLKSVEQYNSYQRRGFGRRGDFRAVNHEAPERNEETGEIIKYRNMNMRASNGGSGEVFRSEKDNTGSYYKRGGYFSRPYRYRKAFAPSDSKTYNEGQANNDYYGNGNYRWEESRHLKMNNSMNIDRMYPNTNRRKLGYAYYENGVQV